MYKILLFNITILCNSISLFNDFFEDENNRNINISDTGNYEAFKKILPK